MFALFARFVFHVTIEAIVLLRLKMFYWYSEVGAVWQEKKLQSYSINKENFIHTEHLYPTQTKTIPKRQR